jgi:hypothetical protein
MLSGLTIRIKVYYMNKLLPNQVYAGLVEILKDQTLYYHSKIGANYCHLTEEGEKEVLNWIKLMAPYMHDHEKDKINKSAKEMVWEELKK